MEIQRVPEAFKSAFNRITEFIQEWHRIYTLPGVSKRVILASWIIRFFAALILITSFTFIICCIWMWIDEDVYYALIPFRQLHPNDVAFMTTLLIVSAFVIIPCLVMDDLRNRFDNRPKPSFGFWEETSYVLIAAICISISRFVVENKNRPFSCLHSYCCSR